LKDVTDAVSFASAVVSGYSFALFSSNTLFCLSHYSAKDILLIILVRWQEPHESDSPWSITKADHLQDSSSGIQVSARHGPRVPPGVLPANVNCRMPTSPDC